MEANQNAPVFAKGEVEVDASPEIVWEMLSDFRNWPSWNPDVRWAVLDGDLKPGTQFRWKSGPGTITSRLQTIEPRRKLSWSGKTLGIKAIHVWTLEQRDGKTVVRTEESWDGWVVRLLRGYGKATLQKAVETGLRHLKTGAELKSRS